MITIQDILNGQDKRKEFWPTRYHDNPLSLAYRNLKNVMNGYSLLILNYSMFTSIFEGRKFEDSKNITINYRNKHILKSLNNKSYIYLTPTKLCIWQCSMASFLSRNDNEYVAILKWEGLVGYSILILGFETRSYGFLDPEYEEFGNHCGLMEVLSDGTIILFERTVPWDKVKVCRANTTSIRNLFFTEHEIKLIGLTIDNIMNNPAAKANEIYKCRIGEHIFNNEDTIPF